MRATILKLQAATITAIGGVIVALISSGTVIYLYNRPTSTQTTTVTVTVTAITTVTYPQTTAVPNVVGQDFRTADVLISAQRLTPQGKAVPGNRSGNNVVYVQDPQRGTVVAIGTVVKYNYSVGNQAQAYFTSLLWGQSVGPGPAGLLVKGQIVNTQSLGNRSFYLVLQTSSLLFGQQYWVQDKPSVLPNGTWVGQVSFGFQELFFGSAFQLGTVLVPQPLPVGIAISSLPVNSTVNYIPLYFSNR